MIVNLKEIDFAIFDFDGTLVNLMVDWGGIRGKLKLDSIENIWDLPSEEQAAAWKYVSEAELEGVSLLNLIETSVSILRSLDFAVLTNN